MAYEVASLTVDAVVFYAAAEGVKVLMIQRSYESDAEPGKWALPGGYVDEKEELAEARDRELLEETSIFAPEEWDNGWVALPPQTSPWRDPRGRVVSFPFAMLIKGPHYPPGQARSDARALRWVELDNLRGHQVKEIAFDHAEIIANGADHFGFRHFLR